MVQSSCSVKNGKLNEMIEVSALWSICHIHLTNGPGTFPCMIL